MRRVFLILCLALPLPFGCGREEKHTSEASGEEETLRTGEVRLNESAQDAIGLKFVTAKKRKVADSLPVTGWLMPVPGNEAIIKATTPGFITAAASTGNDPFPNLGDETTAGKKLAALQVFISPQEQAQLISTKEDADATIAQAEVTMRLVGDQLDRYRTAKESINGARLVELQELYDKAQAAFREAKEKLPYLPTEPYRTELGLRPVEVASPLTGRITAVHVAPRQFVAAGDPLWTVADWSQLWLRVPVFEADLPRVQSSEPAQVTLAGDSKMTYAATRIAAPQSTDATRRTIDLYFRVDNVSATLRPGQAVSVALPVSQAVERVVVPFTAVLWDGHGGTWVYVRSGDDEFRRQRIELGRRVGDDVVIERGLADKTEVAVAGAQALYGEEFKSSTPVDDD